MTRITHIFKTYFPETGGGLEEAIRQFGRHALQRGFDVEVVCAGPRSTNLRLPDGIRVRFFKTSLEVLSSPFSLSFARAFRNVCRETDILHFHFPWPAAELLAITHGINKPALATFHCDIHRLGPLKTLYQPVVNRFLKKMDRICVSSRRILSTSPCLVPFRARMEEIPYFLNERRFHNLPAPDPQLVEFTGNLSEYALFTGVLRWYKGLDVLLDAAQKTDAPVVIVGKGGLHPKLAARIEQEGLRNVHLLGFRNDADYKWLVQQARLVVLPSTSPAEAFGQVLLEGLYFSKPLVSTELGTATSFVNRHDYSGLVVRPGCADALAGAMNRILKDDGLRQRFSDNARLHYLNHFTARAQGEKYIRLYRALT